MPEYSNSHIKFSRHALKRAQQRGIPQSAVKMAIKTGISWRNGDFIFFRIRHNAKRLNAENKISPVPTSFRNTTVVTAETTAGLLILTVYRSHPPKLEKFQTS